jgi:hypothetical protein
MASLRTWFHITAYLGQFVSHNIRMRKMNRVQTLCPPRVLVDSSHHRNIHNEYCTDVKTHNLERHLHLLHSTKHFNLIASATQHERVMNLLWRRTACIQLLSAG